MAIIICLRKCFMNNRFYENIDFFSSKDASASQRLKSSFDIFFPLGILLRNSVVTALEVVSLV